EDGIRDFHVTGVQTCALPISAAAGVSQPLIIKHFGSRHGLKEAADAHVLALAREALEPLITGGAMPDRGIADVLASTPVTRYLRSEERRVGRGRRAR